MQRRKFIKDSVLAGLVLSIPNVIRATSFNKNDNGFLKLLPDLNSPQFTFFAIDSLGKNKLLENIMLPPAAPKTGMLPQIAFCRLMR